jgi:hypothetical protein
MTQPKTDNELLQEISRKLTEVIALSGLAKVSDKKEDKIRYLVGFGLSNSDISRLTGFPEGTVAPIRAALNKSSKKR